MELQILFIVFFTALIHAAECFNYSVRLSGIRVSKLAVALSLNSIIALVSRTSNLIQSPLTGNLIDSAKLGQEPNLLLKLQFVISGSTLGTVLAIILFPTLVLFGITMINHFESTRSIGKMFIRSLSLSNIKTLKFSFPKLNSYKLHEILVFKKLIITNIIITGVYTVGVLSAQYAAFLVPEYSTMAVSSAGLINGVAMILMAVIIDPQIALLSDKVMGGQGSQREINLVYGLLMVSRLLGTLLAQVLLYPAAKFIAVLCQWVSSLL